MSRFALPLETAFSDAGVALPGAKLYFYQTGTTTPAATYSDDALTTPNSNPVVADAGGRFSNIWLTPTATYKVVLKTSADITVWTADPVAGGGINASHIDGLVTADALSDASLDLQAIVAKLVWLPGGAGGAVRTLPLKLGDIVSRADYDTDANTEAAAVALANRVDLLTRAVYGTANRRLSNFLGDGLSVRDFGAKGDGSTDDTAAIAAMATAMGYVRFTRGNYRVLTATLDVPVHFDQAAYLTVDSGQTYTITHTITSPRQHIFRGSGLVALSSDTNSGENARMAHVAFFGAYAASSSGGVDQAPAIQRAITAMGNSRESEVYFDFGNYHVYTAMTLTRGCHIKGSGTRRSVIRLNADGFDVFTTTAVACKVSDIQFEVEAPLTQRLTGAYIRISHGECEIYNVQCFAAFTGIIVTANNCRIDNVVGTFGTDFGAGSALVHIASGSGSRVSNIQAGTSDNGPEAMVRLGGSAGGAVSGVIVENVQHSAPAASVHVEAFAGNIQRCVIKGIDYNGSAGTAPAYAVKFASSGTRTLSDITLSDVVVNSYATNGVLFEQGSSGTMEDILLDNIDVTGSSGIGIAFNRSAGTLRDVRISDTVDVSERATPYSYSGTSAVRIAPMSVPDCAPAYCYTWTVADDAVQVIDLQRSVFSGVGILTVGSSQYGMFLVRAASSPAVTAMTTASSGIATTTGALTGTTGTDGKITLSTADKFIYIENRLGSSQGVNFTLLTGN